MRVESYGSLTASSARSARNWAGCPLCDYETVLNYIRTTRTETGLRVKAHLIKREYPTGVKISKKQIATIALERRHVQPHRNYTIHPRHERAAELGTYFLSRPLASSGPP
jgi:hypothetical protein